MGHNTTDRMYEDEELKSDVLGAAMSKKLGYNAEIWDNPEDPLTRKEYNRNGLGLVNAETVAYRFSSEEHPQDGWNQVKKKLDLDVCVGRRERKDEQQFIREIREQSENGIAPTLRSMDGTSREAYSEKETDLFATYLDAVWLAGSQPATSWFHHEGDAEEAKVQRYLNFTADNYWSGDPNLNNKTFNARETHLSPCLNPMGKDFTASTKFQTIERAVGDEGLPNLRQGNRPSPISRSEQDTIMDLVEEGHDYDEIVEKVEETFGLSQNQAQDRVNYVLTPAADPEDGGSYGRWMSQSEFPEGGIVFTSGTDPR